MAKQKGIHQIKGKVGDMSYYQSAGVPGGLIRRIPEGLSSRVKTADEYANTRLNNDEFKNASSIAAFAFRAVPNRKSSMMRRFAVAEMIKEALQYIKDGSGNWGQRIPSAKFDNIITDLLENHSKGGPYSGEFGEISVERSAENVITITLSYDSIVASRLLSLGIDGFFIIRNNGAFAQSLVSGSVETYAGLSAITVTQASPINPDGDEESFTLTPAPASLGMSSSDYLAAGDAANNGMFGVLTLIPYRQIGSQLHTLYEYATFASLAFGSIPTT